MFGRMFLPFVMEQTRFGYKNKDGVASESSLANESSSIKTISMLKENEKIPNCRIEKEFEKLTAKEIIQIMEEKEYSLDICEWGCRAFVSITGLAMRTSNAKMMMAEFLDDGGCESLLILMYKYCATSSSIASNGCLIICILAWSLVELREHLGDIGACEVVIYSCEMHIGDPLVSTHGTRAISLLAKDNNNNSLRFSESSGDIIHLLTQVGNFAFNIRNDYAVEVATNVCLALVYLCEAKNFNNLVENETVSFIIELMKIHIKNSKNDFTIAVIQTICSLSSLNYKIKEELGDKGVCEYIIDIIYNNTTSVFILEQSCEAIMHLSLSHNNNPKLTMAGACEAIIFAFRSYLFETAHGCEVCSGAILNLMSYGITASENKDLFKQLKAIRYLWKAQMSKSLTPKAKEYIEDCLLILNPGEYEYMSTDSRTSFSSNFSNKSLNNNNYNYNYNNDSTEIIVPTMNDFNEEDSSFLLSDYDSFMSFNDNEINNNNNNNNKLDISSNIKIKVVASSDNNNNNNNSDDGYDENNIDENKNDHLVISNNNGVVEV